MSCLCGQRNLKKTQLEYLWNKKKVAIFYCKEEEETLEFVEGTHAEICQLVSLALVKQHPQCSAAASIASVLPLSA